MAGFTGVRRLCIAEGYGELRTRGEHEPHRRRWTCWLRGHLRIMQVWSDGVVVETRIKR